MKLTELKINGFTLDTRSSSCTDSVFYVNDDDEDTWLEILWDTMEDNRIILHAVIDGSSKVMTTLIGNEIDNLETFANKIADKIINGEIK